MKQRDNRRPKRKFSSGRESNGYKRTSHITPSQAPPPAPMIDIDELKTKKNQIGKLLRNKNDILYSARLQSVVTDVLDASNFFTSFEMRVNGVLLNSFQFGGANIPYLRNLIFS